MGGRRPVAASEAVGRPNTLGPNVPFPPQEAELVEDLPRQPGRWQYEPKWDGFRGVLENDGGALALWSRNGRPLLRYFPELRALGALLPPHSALDGEIVIEQRGRLEFDLMQLRLHPAESRIKKLSAETPATYVVFDMLLWDGVTTHTLPLEERRRELEAKAKGFLISPATRDVALAEKWLDGLEAAGLDGVIAKRLGLPYLPGSREAVAKVKRHKTADCVIVGYRSGGKRAIGALLLGLYRDDGTLDFVGHTSGIDEALQQKLQELLPPLVESGHPGTEPQEGWGRQPGGQSRWSRGRDLEWTEVKPVLVCEVRYDKLEGDRFRHGTGFLRFRPDKDPRQCTWDQVRPPRRADDLTVADLLKA
jgi:ATP-dependent DNA ligase